MDDITEEQKKIVNELRSRTINDATPKMLEDVSLFYRFAKARDFDLTEAEAMLRKHIAWRKEFHIDKILTDYEPPEVLVKYLPTTLLGFDRKGSILRYNDCGRTDVKGFWYSTKNVEFAKYFAYIIEKDKEMVIKQGRHLGNPLYCVIDDFENFAYTNTMSIKIMQYLLYTLRMFVDNYPETIRQVFVVNAPVSFTLFYAVMKPILPDVVIQKVRIYGAGTDAWKEDVLQFIDADILPAFCGGNKTDPDGNPLCKTFVRRGRTIPKSYYMSNRCKKLSLQSDVEKLTVASFSKEEITFQVKEENSYLRWEFETKNRDIDFSLIFRDESSEDFDSVELIPKQRVDTSDEPDKGCWKCEKVGKYTMIFDNSFSWLHTKEIHYRAGIYGAENEDIYKAI